MHARSLGALGVMMLVSLLLLNCGGGGGGGSQEGTANYSIGGMVSGLTGTLLLQNNGGDDLSLGTSGSFNFATRLASGSAYVVTVSSEPAGQTCSVINARGSVAGANVTSVFVTCTDSLVSGPSITSLDAFEPDNDAASPSTITVGVSQLRTLYNEGDIDAVAVDLNAGTTYEISANRLSPGSDTFMYLLDTDGTTTLVSGSTDTVYSDDYIGRDSMIRTTPTSTGTYYIEVMSYKNARYVSGLGGLPYGIATYTLNVHTVIDADSDGFSDYYDCNDSDPAVHPSFLLDLNFNEVPGDGIDQDCSATDEPVGTFADKAEPDSDMAHAKELAQPVGDPFEIIFRQDIFTPNGRTIHTAGDKDWFTFTLPAYGAAEVYTVINKVTGPNDLQMTIYEADGSTLVFQGSLDPYYVVTNSTAVSATYYVVFEAADGVGTGFYVPYMLSIGTDQDSDTFYTLDFYLGHDCNDSNDQIFPFALGGVCGQL